ncbi:conserved hypothetical protein [Leishmania braziliensis MHOM/BR/75/M2904]|uniref:Uncharacterized protein n=1 Tax=Leishmania braziliensis TaxID=5660 RepID=A4H890_LEIBR|nr:conserved hypothetical protein [Leishmania braziliensis MHOM/BR/75/M2904]CAM42139.2 conserved hypothetical protein [Leishmania braziliensis MHOM/BR/75/M2904]
MEIDSLKIQLTNLLTLPHDSDTNEDDAVVVIFDYIHGAHKVANMLLLEERLPELQQCLHLCQAAIGEIALGLVAETTTAAADTASEEAATSAGAAPSTTHDTSGPLGANGKAVDSVLSSSLLPSSPGTTSKPRRTPLALRRDKDRHVFSVLASRTARLQKQLEASMRVWQNRNTNHHLHKLNLEFRDDGVDGTLDRCEAAASICFVQWQLQQLPHAAPMTLALPPTSSRGAPDSSAQMPAIRPPPRATRLSAPVQGGHGGSPSLRLPSLSALGTFGTARQQAILAARPPSPPPRRGIVTGERSNLNGWRPHTCLPPLATDSRALGEGRYQAHALAGGALHKRLQSTNHVGTPAAEDREVKNDGGIRAAQQLYGTQNEDSISLYSHDIQEKRRRWSSSVAVTQPSPTASYHATQLASRTMAVNDADEKEEADGSVVYDSDAGGCASGQVGFAPFQRPHTGWLLRAALSRLGSTASTHVPALSPSSPWRAGDGVPCTAASVLATDSHTPPPAQSPSNLAEAFTPRCRVLPVSTNAPVTTSSAANAMDSSTPLQLKAARGVPRDDAHAAISAASASILTPCSASLATPSMTSELLSLQSDATVAGSLPPLTGLATTTSTISADAARVVQAARQAMQFAMTSLKAQHHRTAQALEQYDDLALSRLSYSARQSLIASCARQATHECVGVRSSSTGGSGGDESSVWIASPASVDTPATPNCSLAAAVAVTIAEQHQLQHRRPLPPLCPLPSQQLSPGAEQQLRELHTECEQQLAASVFNVREMEARWLAQHRQLEACVALPRLKNSAECCRHHRPHPTQRSLYDPPHCESTCRRPGEQYSHSNSRGRGHARGAAPLHTFSVPPSPTSPECKSPVAPTVMAEAAAATATAVMQQGDDQSEDGEATSPALGPSHTEIVAPSGITAAYPFSAIAAVSSEKGVSEDASGDSSVLRSAAETMRPVATVLPPAKHATQGTQESGDAAGTRIAVALAAASAQPSQQGRHSDAGGAAGHYTYNAAVDALVYARLTARTDAVPPQKARASLAAAEESGPSTVEETLVAWRCMLQAMGSTSTTTAVVRGSGIKAVEMNVGAAYSCPSQASVCEAAAAVAQPPSTAKGDVRRMGNYIRWSADLVRGRRTQRVVCEALRQASKHVHPGDLVRPAWGSVAAAHPQPSLLELPGVCLTDVDEAEASTKALAMCLTASASTTSPAPTGAAVTFNSAAPSPPATVGLLRDNSSFNKTSPTLSVSSSQHTLTRWSRGKDIAPWLPSSVDTASTSPRDVTSEGSSTAAVTGVLRQLHAAYRANAMLRGIKDWTAVAPVLLARSLPLSVRAVRIQKWWRQRLAVRLCQQRRSARETYLIEEERLDAAALRLQRQIRVHWAQEASARRAAACAAWTEHRVAAERTSTKHSGFVNDLAGGSVAFGASNSLTWTPPMHSRLGGVVAPHVFSSSGGGGGASSSSQPVSRAHSAHIASAAEVDKGASIFFRSALATVAPGDDDAVDGDRGRCEMACSLPSRTKTTPLSTTTPTEAVSAMALTAAASLPGHLGTASKHRPLPTHRTSGLQTPLELLNTAAQRIQRCYRHHLTAHTARLCQDVEVLSAVLTRRAPLAAIRMTLTASPTSSVALSVAASARESVNAPDALVMRNLLDLCTGDVYEAHLQRSLAARRHGDYKTALHHVCLRDLQRIRQEREREQQRWERQVLEVTKTIQRVGRGYWCRRWLHERGLKMRQSARHHQIEVPRCSPMSGLQSVQLLSPNGLGAQRAMSEDDLCAQLAGGEAVSSHMMLRLRAVHPQWFEIAADPTSAQYIALHRTPAQLAAVTITEAFVAAFASRAEVYNKYRHGCAKSLQLAWRLHRAKLHGCRTQSHIVSASES